MSAAPSLALESTPQRGFPRHPIAVPLDLIALRSGVPETLPGRCIDITEAGLGAVIAGELAAAQQVAVELRLPNVGVPVRARAVVRYQSRYRCGIEFVGLSAQQREMIRYWIYRRESDPLASKIESKIEQRNVALDFRPSVPLKADSPETNVVPTRQGKRKIRIGRGGLLLLILGALLLLALVVWQWQRSWNELETRAQAADARLRVSAETMEKRILTKVDPVYPEAARVASTEGLVVLDAIIAPDGSVERLRPLSGPDLLVQSATEAVRSWKFEPYLSSGKAVGVETTIAVDFRLN
jgi:TonB family protein